MGICNTLSFSSWVSFFFHHEFHKSFFKRFYLFIHESHRKRGRDTGRGRSRLPARSPMWHLIQDSGITPWAEPKADTQLLSHPGVPKLMVLLFKHFFCYFIQFCGYFIQQIFTDLLLFASCKDTGKNKTEKEFPFTLYLGRQYTLYTVVCYWDRNAWRKKYVCHIYYIIDKLLSSTDFKKRENTNY